MDTALPFGLRSAPKLFNAVVDAVEWILQQAMVVNIVHYLDDFLLVNHPGSPEGAESLAKLLEIFAELCLPVALDKLEGPVYQLTFLVFELDSILMEVQLPVEKLAALNTVVSSWLDRWSCTRKELKSLVGSLGHVARVVQSGRSIVCSVPVGTQRNEDIITLRELLLIVLACAAWGPYWSGHSVVVHCSMLSSIQAIVGCRQ